MELRSEFLARKFQAALSESDLKTAIKPEFAADSPMDNSRSWVEGKPNPIKIWAEMKSPDRWNRESVEYEEMKQIFDVLMKTGGSKWLNEIDPNDGKRPIDAAANLTFLILLETGGVDLNPTALDSPLQYVLRSRQHVSWSKLIVNETDPALLDWVNPITGQTALHIACTENSEDDKSDLIFVLLQRAGAVNPSHSCFAAQPVTSPSQTVVLLSCARLRWNRYRSGHLPNQISKTAPNLLQDLVELIVDYAC